MTPTDATSASAARPAAGAPPAAAGGLLAGLLRPPLLRELDRLPTGRVQLRDGDREWTLGRAESGPVPRITVHDPRFYRSVAFSGALGAAEAWAAGWWTCDDPTGLLRSFVRAIVERRSGSLVTPRLLEPFARLAHRLRGNTRRGSRRNIRDHYDLGNDFFRLFLDDTMTYSCGIFPHEGASLRDASIEKLDRVCRKLALQPGHRVLEIGSGWGSFALHAAGRYGCRVTTTTISREQEDEVRRRVREAGVEGRIEVVRRDYRDLEGTYDRLVSIEMIEAVGHEHLEDYWRAIDRRLAPDGLGLVQAIVMPDRDHAAYLRSVDFIQKHVFPGSCLPSPGSIGRAIARATSLRVEHTEDIGLHYARTLRLWRERFLAEADAIRALGHSERFLRIWHWYFSYCEAGFAEKYLGDLQIVVAKPGARYDAAPLAAAPTAVVPGAVR